MLDRLIRSTWGMPLVQRALEVIRDRPKLIVFPMLVGPCLVAVALFFFAPLALLPTGHPFLQSGHWQELMQGYGHIFSGGYSGARPGWVYAYLGSFYFAAMACGVFLDVAFYHEIMQALAGEPVSIRRGLVFACRRLPSVIAWSLMAATVGVLLKVAGERLGWLGQRIMGAVGLAWSVASIFVVPVMIKDPAANPIKLLRNSALTLKGTWGEAILGYAGLAGGAMLAALGWVIVTGVMVFLAALSPVGGGPLVLAAFGLGILGFFAIAYLSALATNIHRCALYLYATEGDVPRPFTPRDMDAAWRVR